MHEIAHICERSSLPLIRHPIRSLKTIESSQQSYKSQYMLLYRARGSVMRIMEKLNTFQHNLIFYTNGN